MNKMTRKLVYMIMGAFLAVSWVSPGAGTYIPLKVSFIAGDANEILNDIQVAEGEYAYVDSGKAQGNPWIWFDSGSGRFRMTQSRSTTAGRYVKVLPNNITVGQDFTGNCALYPNPPTLPSQIKWFWFTSGGELRDDDNDGVLEPGDPALPLLNFKDMAVDETRYCTMFCRFQTFENQCEFDWGSAPSPEASDLNVQVTLTLINGQKVWVVRPYVSALVDRNGKPVQDCTDRQMWRTIYLKRSGAGYGGQCNLGVWEADFELHIALK